MTSSSPAPKLPMWIFWVTDAVLLTAAAYIANNSPRPLPDAATFGIVACIIAGAVVALVPLVAFYERQKNETLDDRQRALEALARTVETSAEQISIAAGGLHEIAELAQRNLKHAEQLPQKLQEKMAEFQAQLSNASDAEKEELEKEVEELRASETERLESTADRIAKAAAEFAKLQASFQQQLSAATAATTKLASATGGAATQSQAAAEQALAHARELSAKAVGDSVGTALKDIERARAAALHEINAQFDRQVGRLREATQQFETVVARIQAAAPQPQAGPAQSQPSAAHRVAPDSAPPETALPAEPAGMVSAPAADPASQPVAVAEPPAPKRSRKPRHEPAAAKPAESAGPNGEAAPSAGVSAPGASTSGVAGHEAAQAEHAPAAVAESAPADAKQPAPAAAEPAAPPAAGAAKAHDAGAAGPANGTAPAEPVTEKPVRKRPARKADDDQPGLGLDLGDAASAPDGPAAAVVERVLSSDGATRLIVTAYIGIGNRLFVRGHGPGLSWDKGVPLQFVSIGKWRWETNDASGPVQLKLLKNDQQESLGLGALTIDPGHQHEVTATFN